MDTHIASPIPLAGVRARRLLTASGLTEGALHFCDTRISHITPSGHPAQGLLDAGNLLVLPGIVDLHGDAFERAVMPRPGVTFAYDNALADVDRQLLSNGITSEFHGLTLSWEGGLRGQPYAEQMFEALARQREAFGARHNVHLRFETHNVPAVDLALRWIADGRVQFVALNDHLPSMLKRLGDERKLLQYAERAQCDIDTFQARIREAAALADAVPAAMLRLAQGAQAAGLRIASHDDPDGATRTYYHQLGCQVAEFPLTIQAAQVARDLGDLIVFGAPNVVRGRSHTHAPNAADMVGAGLCDVLTSDYYYPALLIAALQLAQQGVLDLVHAWHLVSRNPARAAGLDDLGLLAPAMRADVILVDDSVPGNPRVCATIVGGVLRYADRSFAHDTASSLAHTHGLAA